MFKFSVNIGLMMAPEATTSSQQ